MFPLHESQQVLVIRFDAMVFESGLRIKTDWCTSTHQSWAEQQRRKQSAYYSEHNAFPIGRLNAPLYYLVVASLSTRAKEPPDMIVVLCAQKLGLGFEYKAKWSSA